MREQARSIVVLGMHRSGTSLVAGICEKLGCVVIDPVMPPSGANPKGYFENEDFCDINREILLRTDDIDRFNFFKMQELNFEAHDLMNRWAEAGIPVIKDPRLCLTLGWWWPLFPKPAKVIRVKRNPISVAISLAKRAGLPKDPDGPGWWLTFIAHLELIHRHETRALKTLQKLGISYLDVEYEHLLENPQDAVNRIANHTGLAPYHESVLDLVDPSLSRNASPVNLEPEWWKCFDGGFRSGAEGSPPPASS